MSHLPCKGSTVFKDLYIDKWKVYNLEYLFSRIWKSLINVIFPIFIKTFLYQDYKILLYSFSPPQFSLFMMIHLTLIFDKNTDDSSTSTMNNLFCRNYQTLHLFVIFYQTSPNSLYSIRFYGLYSWISMGCLRSCFISFKQWPNVSLPSMEVNIHFDDLKIAHISLWFPTNTY